MIDVSAAYSDLKIKYYNLKDANAMLKIENNNLSEQKIKLLKRMKEVEQQLLDMHDEVVHKLPKSDPNRNYVTLKKFERQKKLTEYFIELYHKEKAKNK